MSDQETEVNSVLSSRGSRREGHSRSLGAGVRRMVGRGIVDVADRPGRVERVTVEPRKLLRLSPSRDEIRICDERSRKRDQVRAFALDRRRSALEIVAARDDEDAGEQPAGLSNNILFWRRRC